MGIRRCEHGTDRTSLDDHSPGRFRERPVQLVAAFTVVVQEPLTTDLGPVGAGRERRSHLIRCGIRRRDEQEPVQHLVIDRKQDHVHRELT